MILLDTHVVSEVMKARPVETVLAWLNSQESEKLYVSAITIGEITYGLRQQGRDHGYGEDERDGDERVL